jgi:uncharacterized membrane protein YfhO
VIDRPLHTTFAEADTAPRWAARFTAYGINGMTLDVSTERDGLLVLSEIWYPGWKAFVDGKETPLYRTDYSLRGIVVPAGRHNLEVVFRPELFARGAALSGGALAVCAAIAVVSFVRARSSRRSPNEHKT